MASAAPAQVVLDQAASILIYPEIIVGGIRDTTVQIVNTGNSAEHARCFYVNYAGTCSSTGTPCVTANDCSDCVQGSVATEFNINLSRQQPTVWVASQGRASGTSLVPPMTAPFYGELVCVEVNAAGTPTSGNRLIGEATVVDTSSGDVAKYHAAGLQGLDTNDGDNALCLGGGVSAESRRARSMRRARSPGFWILLPMVQRTASSERARLCAYEPDRRSVHTRSFQPNSGAGNCPVPRHEPVCAKVLYQRILEPAL